MYDILTTSAVADELNQEIAGGRIQGAGLRDRSTMVLEIYADRRRHYLVASIGGNEPVCYLASTEVRADPSVVTPFSLLLRKYCRGGGLVAIDQPPLERIIRLTVSKVFRPSGESDQADDQLDEPGKSSASSTSVPPDIVYTALNIELMGRRSNIVLVNNDGVILDALKRVTPDMSRVRPISPHGAYSLPPTGNRVDPRSLSGAQVETILAAAKPAETVVGSLVSAVAAISPQIATEALFRATGSPKPDRGDLSAGSGEHIASEVRSVFAQLDQPDWSPVLYLDENDDLTGYAALPQTHLQVRFSERTFPSISSVVERAHSATARSGRHSGRRDRLVANIASAQERASAKVATLEAQRRELQEGARYRRWGEAILANLWTIAPGQQVLEWENEVIPLSAELLAKDVAQGYFTRYRKAGRGLDQIDDLIDQAANDLAYLDQLIVLATVAESFDEIEVLRHEWEGASARKGDGSSPPIRRKPPRKSKLPKPIADDFGNAIYIGRSGSANDAVTFEIAGPDDYWLHARGAPGAHVILRPLRQDDQSLDSALEAAASLAAYYSASRNNSSAEVDICKRRDVRKIKGAGPGMVTYRNERTIRVKPAPSE